MFSRRPDLYTGCALSSAEGELSTAPISVLYRCLSQHFGKTKVMSRPRGLLRSEQREAQSQTTTFSARRPQPPLYIQPGADPGPLAPKPSNRNALIQGRHQMALRDFVLERGIFRRAGGGRALQLKSAGCMASRLANPRLRRFWHDSCMVQMSQ